MRQLSRTARTAGSVASLGKASAGIAPVRSAHSVATVVAASQAAANCRIGLLWLLLTTSSSHLGAAVTSGAWPWPVLVRASLGSESSSKPVAEGGGDDAERP